MDLQEDSGTEARFSAYAAGLASVLGHADRTRPFEDYCAGLLSAEGRKSVEPLAAATAPARTAAQHQSLLHLVAQAPWSDQAVLTAHTRAGAAGHYPKSGSWYRIAPRICSAAQPLRAAQAGARRSGGSSWRPFR